MRVTLSWLEPWAPGAVRTPGAGAGSQQLALDDALHHPHGPISSSHSCLVGPRVA
jgi:hypothetical protein